MPKPAALRELQRNLEFHFSEVLEYPFAKPYWVYISLSHDCTYNCQMCGVVKILKGHQLSSAVVKRALDEIRDWQRECVVLFTGGEPFLRQEIFELIGYSVKNGIRTEAVSNGSLIDEALAARIVSSGLSNIAISLDGATEQTHDSIRQPGAFRKALHALRCLAETKRRKGHGPQISVWTTVMKENVRELFDVIALVEGLGVECLVYHPVIVAQDDMQNTSPDAPFWIRGDDLGILKEQIDKIVGYRDKKGLVAFLHDPYLWIDYFRGTLTKKQWKCNPFVFLNIGPDADVRSCGAAFGNIRNVSLEECLESTEAYQARKFMKVCEKPCLQTCWAHPESDLLSGIIEAFLHRIKDDPQRQAMIRQAYAMLEGFEGILGRQKND